MPIDAARKLECSSRDTMRIVRYISTICVDESRDGGTRPDVRRPFWALAKVAEDKWIPSVLLSAEVYGDRALSSEVMTSAKVTVSLSGHRD